MPSLTIIDFDDSGSVTLPGGSDPVGNRYEEASLALNALQRCRCGKCLAAVVHFDSPFGDVPPGPLRSRRFQQALKSGLRIPEMAGGTSYLGPSLERAEQLASSHPGHEAQLTILTDWDLFDTDDYVSRLQDFPGPVLAIGLGTAPPTTLASDSIRTMRIDHGDEPGTVAHAILAALTRSRT